jgi:hypothetical protein
MKAIRMKLTLDEVIDWCERERVTVTITPGRAVFFDAKTPEPHQGNAGADSSRPVIGQPQPARGR